MRTIAVVLAVFAAAVYAQTPTAPSPVTQTPSGSSNNNNNKISNNMNTNTMNTPADTNMMNNNMNNGMNNGHNNMMNNGMNNGHNNMMNNGHNNMMNNGHNNMMNNGRNMMNNGRNMMNNGLNNMMNNGLNNLNNGLNKANPNGLMAQFQNPMFRNMNNNNIQNNPMTALAFPQNNNVLPNQGKGQVSQSPFNFLPFMLGNDRMNQMAMLSMMSNPSTTGNMLPYFALAGGNENMFRLMMLGNVMNQRKGGQGQGFNPFTMLALTGNDMMQKLFPMMMMMNQDGLQGAASPTTAVSGATSTATQPQGGNNGYLNLMMMNNIM
ncbi:putative uncharacterized protein DDB_G0286901 [Haliotis rubra]|uniref:putative uncharacterized protein DDB_G0286901 n=1 Tax=Haliotis rubra TaxID=36100 RepID=UPI001EE5B5A4|nr:putative uncharacterized protein DDB_G0286901 [Haliotis rubra]